MVKVEKSITASFDVDPQCGFTPLCPDELPVAEGHLIAEQLNEQAKFTNYRVVSKDCHPPEAPWIATSADQVMTLVKGDYPNLDIKWPAHCIVGTKGNSLIPTLPSETEYDFVVEKGIEPEMHPYGACYHDLNEEISTGIIEWLKENNISQVIVGGLATDYCVKTTVLQLVKAGFKVILNMAACRGIADDSIQLAYQQMKDIGVTLIASSQELVS